MATIKKVLVNKAYAPLVKPYILSFQTLTEFETFSVQINLSNGSSAQGEVVPLYGYSDETPEEIWTYLMAKSNEIEGLDVQVAREMIAKDIPSIPFSTSALLTAIDLLINPLNIELPLDQFDYVTPGSTEKIDELIALHEKICLKQERTVKIKLSGKPKVDIEAFDSLESLIEPHKSRLRLDANQAFNWEDGKRFFEYLNDYSGLHAIQYVEQPFPVKEWDWNEKMIQLFPKVPIMLDESIVLKSDVDRAKKMGVLFVKLKLYKQGGIAELINIASYAKTNEIKVILGNGVAGKLTNQVEVAVYNEYKDLFEASLEANGWNKLA